MMASVVTRLRNHGSGVVTISQFDIQIVLHRLHPLGSKVGRLTRHIAGIRLLRGELAGGQPLGLIGGKQTLASLALQHHCELPCKIVSIVDAAVSAEASIGGHYMSGIARQKYAAFLQALRHIGCRFPVHDILDGGGNVRSSEGRVQIFNASFVGEARGNIGVGMLRIAYRVDHQKPGLKRLFDPEKTS